MNQIKPTGVRVGLAEDSLLLREGLVRLLLESGYQATVVAESAVDLLDKIKTTPVDLIIMDVRMPPSYHDEGIRAALNIRKQTPGFPVLLLSQYVELSYASELLADGAQSIGYLLKDRVASLTDFTAALDRILAGQTVLDPQVVRALMNRAVRPLSALTSREKQTRELMAEGKSNSEISQELSISAGAVEKNVTAIFQKLGLDEEQGGHRRVLAVLSWLQR